jgi:hypothetical protein
LLPVRRTLFFQDGAAARLSKASWPGLHYETAVSAAQQQFMDSLRSGGRFAGFLGVTDFSHRN